MNEGIQSLVGHSLKNEVRERFLFYCQGFIAFTAVCNNVVRHYDGSISIMAFANQQQAVQWLMEMQQMKTDIAQINDDASHY